MPTTSNATKPYVQYDAYLKAGLPIATGVIEGACRHVIRDRMEITGARWSLEGAEAILRLRSLRASGDLEDYWQHHEQRELERNHAAQYAEREDPVAHAARRALPSHGEPFSAARGEMIGDCLPGVRSGNGRFPAQDFGHDRSTAAIPLYKFRGVRYRMAQQRWPSQRRSIRLPSSTT